MVAGKGLWMSPGAKVSVVVLFVLAVAIGVTAYLAAVGYYHREQGAQQRQAQQQQAKLAKQAAQQAAAQRAQGAAFEHRLCTTLGRLASLNPPPGSGGDLSRQYLDRQHQVLAELGPDVGCGR